MDEHLMNEINYVGWRPKPDVDTFFIYLRYLYEQKSIFHIYISHINSTFGIICNCFLVLLLYSIEWTSLKSCHDMLSFSKLNLLDIKFTWFSIVYIVLCTLSIFLYSFRFYNDVQIYKSVSKCLRDSQITEEFMKQSAWEEVIKKLSDNRPKIIVANEEMRYDVHTINNIIMRKDNILIALISSQTIPLWCISRISEHPIREIILHTWLYEKKSTEKILFKSKICGIALLVTCPFTIAHMFIFLLMKNVNEVKHKSVHTLFRRHIRYGHSYLLKRFNELDTDFENRKKLIEYACDYRISLIEAPIRELLMSCLFSIASCAFIYILCISTANDLVLIYVIWPPIYGVSLLWWFAIVSSILALSDRKETESNAYTHESAETFLLEIVSVDIKTLYPYRMYDIFAEVFSCLLSCIILLFYVPRKIHIIHEALESCVCETKLGPMCKYSQFTKEVDGQSLLLNEKMRHSVSEFNVSNPQWLTHLTNSERLIVDHAFEDVLNASGIVNGSLELDVNKNISIN